MSLLQACKKCPILGLNRVCHTCREAFPVLSSGSSHHLVTLNMHQYVQGCHDIPTKRDIFKDAWDWNTRSKAKADSRCSIYVRLVFKASEITHCPANMSSLLYTLLNTICSCSGSDQDSSSPK